MQENKYHKYNFEIDINQKNDARVIAFDMIKENTKVLDVGSACGQFAQILKEHKNCKITGIEYDNESIEIAESKNVFEKIHQLDLNNFDINRFRDLFGYFDYIVFGDVLEHLLFPEKILADFKKLLNPGGKFIVSLPNAAHATVKINLLIDKFEYEEIGILDKTHIKFFTHKTIPAFLASVNLKMEKFGYTVMHVKRHSAEENLSALPDSVKKFIFKNNYSYVLQYVILCKPDNESFESLKDANKIILTPADINKELKKTKSRCFRKYVYLYFLTRIANFFK